MGSTVIILLALVTFFCALAGAIIDLRRTPRPNYRSGPGHPLPAAVAVDRGPAPEFARQ
jgi:uncharacterized protein YraI